MKEIDLVIFDMDGLMFDTERIGFAAWAEAAASYGYEVSENIYKSIIGSNAVRAREIFLSHFGEIFPYEDVRQERTKIGETMLKKHGISIKDGLYEILDYLSKTKVKIAVATSTSRERAASLLKMARVEHYFDYVLCGDEVVNSKPHPEIFLKVADKLGCLPEKSIVLEDSEAGIVAAHSAGMTAIMIPDMKEPEPNIQVLTFKQMRSLHEVKFFLQEQSVFKL